MVKMTREQLRAYEMIGGKISETELTDEQVEEIGRVIKKHADDTMAYLIDADEYHRLLAMAFMLDSKGEDDPDMRIRVAHTIRTVYRRAKVITLSNLLVISDALVDYRDAAQKRKDDAPTDNLDEQAKENNQ